MVRRTKCSRTGRSSPQVAAIPAGTVCIAFSTNATKTTVSLVGVPAAPRMTWHVTDTNEVYNFVGFSLQDGASVTPGDYFEGFDGNLLKGGFFRFFGRNPDAMPNVMQLYASETVSDGDVLLVASDVQGDWSGVLNVSPMNGLDFGSESSRATMCVRNDGAQARMVAVELRTSTSYGEVWWNTTIQEEGMPKPLAIPTLPQVYSIRWPKSGETPQIVLASQLGSAAESVVEHDMGLYLSSTNAYAAMAARKYFDENDGGTVMFWMKPPEERRALPPKVDVTCHMCGRTWTVVT